MVEHKLVSFAAVRSSVNSCNFTDEANSYTSEVEIHTRQNYAILAAMLQKRGAILPSKFRPGNLCWSGLKPGFKHIEFLWRKECEARSRKPSQPGWRRESKGLWTGGDWGPVWNACRPVATWEKKESENNEVKVKTTKEREEHCTIDWLLLPIETRHFRSIEKVHSTRSLCKTAKC